MRAGSAAQGRRLLRGEATLEDLERWAISQGEPELRSGRIEELENRLNDHLWSSPTPRSRRK